MAVEVQMWLAALENFDFFVPARLGSLNEAEMVDSDMMTSCLKLSVDL